MQSLPSDSPEFPTSYDSFERLSWTSAVRLTRSDYIYRPPSVIPALSYWSLRHQARISLNSSQRPIPVLGTQLLARATERERPGIRQRLHTSPNILSSDRRTISRVRTGTNRSTSIVRRVAGVRHVPARWLAHAKQLSNSWSAGGPPSTRCMMNQ